MSDLCKGENVVFLLKNGIVNNKTVTFRASMNLRSFPLIIAGVLSASNAFAQDKNPLEQKNTGWFSGYFQNQYFSSNRTGQQSGLFRNRRARLTYTYMGDGTFMAKVQLELAGGTNQQSTQIKDAWIQYRPGGFATTDGESYTIGSLCTPLGYEMEYGSSSRLWPEYSLLTQTYFNGEFGRGLVFRDTHGGFQWMLGAMNALPNSDPEQNDIAPKGDIGVVGGIRSKTGAFDIGLARLESTRPTYTSGAVNLPSTNRSFTTFDLTYKPSNSKFLVRGEATVGHDRVPLAAGGAGTPLSAAHLAPEYKLNKRDTLMLRWDTLDRDTDTPGNTQTLFGLGVVRDLNKNIRLSAAFDWNNNPTLAVGQQKYQTATFRVQFKF